MTETTRAKSAKKPADHKPAKTATIAVEFKGITFDVEAGALSSLRVLDLLERNQFTTALRRIVGDESFEHFLDNVPGASAEDAGSLLELIAEAAGVKN
ncbi:hypothetical protein [Leucobacter sp. G161]|uniref:hypothetical protein n=1 Tax=Leucobacter sp. G161 TaxID=663704 RepID=UPI00073B1B4B|nr:hypothetical protein [Leucobacter sp. G161]KUF05700.1 hypothetical protein AUL38_16020 [Leucobacter sp. G161]